MRVKQITGCDLNRDKNSTELIYSRVRVHTHMYTHTLAVSGISRYQVPGTRDHIAVGCKQRQPKSASVHTCSASSSINSRRSRAEARPARAASRRTASSAPRARRLDASCLCCWFPRVGSSRPSSISRSVSSTALLSGGVLFTWPTQLSTRQWKR